MATAVTTPDEFTLAVVASLLLHAPPVTASVSALVSPRHTLSVPVIADGKVFTVTGVVT